MNQFDPNDEAKKEQEAQEEIFNDLLTTIRCLLANGEKQAALTLIKKSFPD